MPSDRDAETYCLPGGISHTTYRDVVDPEQRPLLIAHEAAHRARCRADGFVRVFYGRFTGEGVAMEELVAFCAEMELRAPFASDSAQLGEIEEDWLFEPPRRCQRSAPSVGMQRV